MTAAMRSTGQIRRRFSNPQPVDGFCVALELRAGFTLEEEEGRGEGGKGERKRTKEDVTKTRLGPRPKIFTVWSFTENWDPQPRRAVISCQEGWTDTDNW